MGKNIVKVVFLGLMAIGLMISLSNFMPRAYASIPKYGTVHMYNCIPSDWCWMKEGLCCCNEPSNCCIFVEWP